MLEEDWGGCVGGVAEPGFGVKTDQKKSKSGEENKGLSIHIFSAKPSLLVRKDFDNACNNYTM